MQKILIVFFSLMFTAVAVQSQSIFSKWSALDDYHSVMSGTFHPSEDGNLEPIKKRSGELRTHASLVAKSKIPAEFDSKAIRKTVKRLSKDSKALDKLVQSKVASDDQITKSLAALHDVFHEIVGLCKEGH